MFSCTRCNEEVLVEEYLKPIRTTDPLTGKPLTGAIPSTVDRLIEALKFWRKRHRGCAQRPAPEVFK